VARFVSDRKRVFEMKLLIIGYDQLGQMGNYLASAANGIGIDYTIMDVGRAETRSRIMQAFHWRFLGKKPANLAGFAAQVLETCRSAKPSLVITTGNRVPLERRHIEEVQKLGIKIINYSTDDPWNRVMRAGWFIDSLPYYDAVFTPRRANFDDFHRCGVRAIHYMPFAYDPEVHQPWPRKAPTGAPSDVLFVGGCDAERLPIISALAESGFELALFGRYWNRHHRTRAYWRGVAGHSTIRAASAAASICLCLVRRANRDGHVMRSFEAAAIGGCILAEDTDDHREFFGPEDHAVRYFRTIPEMLRQVEILVADANLRLRLSITLRQRMAARNDTYSDRLEAMLRLSALADSSQCSTVTVG
jgi:spore maturation protein CgeB